MGLHSKDRFKKVDITDIAIKKVRRIVYKGLTEEQNDMLYRLSRFVLIQAQQENDSNESAITIDLNDLNGRFGTVNGTDHYVDVDADPVSYHLLRTGMFVAVIHNHPSTQTLSIEDVRFFLHFIRLKMMIVVSNQGTVHYLMKDNEYDYTAAEQLRRECVADLTKDSSERECYEAALDFLTHCSEAGLYYR